MPQTKVIDDVLLAAESLRRGLIVAFATETVYGLGVDSTNPLAVKRLFEAKGRPSDNPLIVHLGSLDRWPLAAARLTRSAEMLLRTFAPGPITVVVEKAEAISDLVTAGLNTVGLRIPGNQQARQLLEACDLPIAAPSANLSGRPSCTTWESVMEDLDGRIDYVLRGESCEVGLESTVVDCTGEFPVILRPGKISLEQIQNVIPGSRMFAADQDCNHHPPASPGIRHAHYQPEAQLVLFQSFEETIALPADQRIRAAVIGMRDSINLDYQSVALNGFFIVKLFDSLDQYAREFYEQLRNFDRLGIEVVYVQLVGNTDKSAALRDRQLRAAGRY